MHKQELINTEGLPNEEGLLNKEGLLSRQELLNAGLFNLLVEGPLNLRVQG